MVDIDLHSSPGESQCAATETVRGCLFRQNENQASEKQVEILGKSKTQLPSVVDTRKSLTLSSHGSLMRFIADLRPPPTSHIHPCLVPSS